jgi:DNA primase
VNEDHQCFKRFGCGRGGDVFTFVMEIQGLSFYESLRFLAKQNGVPCRSASRKQIEIRHGFAPFGFQVLPNTAQNNLIFPGGLFVTFLGIISLGSIESRIN